VYLVVLLFFFFQAEDGIRDFHVTGVQTCALPICLLGFTTPGNIETTLPVLMFCVAFGLSMDYGVFLLSRVKEEYDRSGDHERARSEERRVGKECRAGWSREAE